MKVKVKIAGREFRGELVGLMLDDDGDTSVVVRIDGHGILLQSFHPSAVSEVKP